MISRLNVLCTKHIYSSAYDRGAAFRRIFGNRAPALLQRLDLLGAQYGITFRWNGKTGNPRDAHKLVLLAMQKDEAEAESKAALSPPPPEMQESPLSGRQPSNPPNPSRPPPHHQTHLYATVSYIFRAAFQQGADPSSRDFLAHAAVTLGLFASEDDAMAYFAEYDTDDDGFHEADTADGLKIDLETQPAGEEGEHEHHHRGGDHQNNQPGSISEGDLHLTNQRQNHTLEKKERTQIQSNHQATEHNTITITKKKTRTTTIDTATSRARALGVAAVPSYIVQGRWQVGGMQREGVWLGVFERARAAFAAEASIAADEVWVPGRG